MGKIFKIKTPIGYFIVEEKGVELEYPGVWISFSKDGKKYNDELIACVEYDTFNEEIKTECYEKNREDPISIVRYEDGVDLMR